MTIRRRHFNALALSCGLMPLQAWAQARPGLLNFALISPRAVEQTRANWLPFAQRVAKAMSQEVNLRVFESQAEIIKAFVAGEIDIAWMGNVPALEVVEAGSGSVFAQMVTKEGSFGYKSVLMVPQGSRITSLGDIVAQAKSLRFSDGEPKSTSGYLVPLYFAFQKRGINDTKTIFKTSEVGSHQQNLKKIAQGEVDVATANNEEIGFFERDFPELAKKIKVVWESPLIPQSPLLWRSSLPLEAKRKMKAFVYGFGATPEEKRILEGVNNLSRFRPSSNLQLVPVADLEMFKARQAINNDGSLSAEERARRIDEVSRRGSRIELRLKLIDPALK